MSLWRRILQGLTAFSADTVISNLAAVLGAVLVFRYLEVSVYGELTLALSFYASATVLLDFGLSSVFTAEIARARGSGNLGWVRFLLVRYLWLNAVMGSIMLVVFLFLAKRNDVALWGIMGVYLLTTTLNNVMKVLFHSYTRYRRLAAQSIVRSLSRVVFLAALPFWWRGEDLLGVAWTYPLMDLAALVASVGLARRAVRGLETVRTDEYSWASLGALLRERGIYVILSVPVKKIAEQLPVWFLKALLGDFGVGVYGAAQKGYSLVISFFRSLETTVFPLVSEQAAVDTERLRIALRQMQKYSFWMGVAVAVLGGLMAKWLIILVAGAEYFAAVPLFRLWLWRLLIYAFSQSQRPIFFAVGEQKWLFLVYVLSTVAEVAFLLTGIRFLGVIGAVWAILLNSTIFVTVRYGLIYRLAPELWIDPRGIFRVEGFDRRLWRRFKEKSFKFLTGNMKR